MKGELYLQHATNRGVSYRGSLCKEIKCIGRPPIMHLALVGDVTSGLILYVPRPAETMNS